MTYASLLVHVEPGPSCAPRLACAVALSDRLGATVVGLGAEAIPPLPMNMGGPYAAAEGEWIVAMTEQITTDLTAAETRFRQAVGTRPRQWRQCRSEPTQALMEASAAADLIVAGGGPREHDLSRVVDTAGLIIGCGRPVLVCPVSTTPLSLRSVLIAWKNTREARRALSDALPLLAQADKVTVLEVCTPDSVKDADARTSDVVASLARHGVPARAEVFVKHHRSTAETLCERADAVGADLIVSGGFGHSRLGEWALGGVTQALLEQTQRFVLFSH